jgi:hypothetical protein
VGRYGEGALYNVYILQQRVARIKIFYPVAIGTLALFLFLFLFMWFGYSIRLPFFLSIEPCPRVAVGMSTDNTQAIEDVKKQVRLN